VSKEEGLSNVPYILAYGILVGHRLFFQHQYIEHGNMQMWILKNKSAVNH